MNSCCRHNHGGYFCISEYIHSVIKSELLRVSPPTLVLLLLLDQLLAEYGFSGWLCFRCLFFLLLHQKLFPASSLGPFIVTRSAISGIWVFQAGFASGACSFFFSIRNSLPSIISIVPGPCSTYETYVNSLEPLFLALTSSSLFAVKVISAHSIALV